MKRAISISYLTIKTTDAKKRKSSNSMFSLELEDEEESHFYLILKAGSFHLMLDMHLCNV